MVAVADRTAPAQTNSHATRVAPDRMKTAAVADRLVPPCSKGGQGGSRCRGRNRTPPPPLRTGGDQDCGPLFQRNPNRAWSTVDQLGGCHGFRRRVRGRSPWQPRGSDEKAPVTSLTSRMVRSGPESAGSDRTAPGADRTQLRAWSTVDQRVPAPTEPNDSSGTPIGDGFPRVAGLAAGAVALLLPVLVKSSEDLHGPPR